jgi:ubiquinol-cytochrome c reductase cytochrome b subunit
MYISRLLGSPGSDGIGVVTFARFYAAHVLILPPLALLLIIFHVYLVRRHGVAAAPGDELKPKKMFFPEQVFKDTVAVFIAFAILFTMAVAARVPLEHMADPTDTTYVPRPEWYFLFLFQILRLFKGPMEVFGTLVLPPLAVVGLLLTPFIDRSKLVRVRQRTLAMGVVFLALLGWGGLTGAAVLGTPPQTEASEIDYSGPTDWLNLTAPQMAGVQIFRDAKCGSCHATASDAPASSGPNLLTTASKRSNAEWLTGHVKEKGAGLTDAQVRDVSALMLRLKPDSEDLVGSAPKFAAMGAGIYEKNNCGACHSLNGVGGKIGPPMNGLAKRRTEAWTRDHFNDPKKLSQGSIMPPYKFTPEEMSSELSYLLTLPDRVAGQ